MNQPNHWHCLDECEKAAGEDTGWRVNGFPDTPLLICARCGAPFVPCTPETCPDAGGNRP